MPNKYSFFLKAFLGILFISFFLSQLEAAPIGELQEINLSKAELAIVDKDYSLAYKLITKNLSRKNFHYNSYIFLANFYIEKGLWSKAIRVYYYLIKKLHTNQVLKFRYTTDLPPYINDLPAPKAKVLEVYFKTANLYFSLYTAGVFSDNYSAILLHHAKRFFYLCFYYKYDLPSVNYYLSLIELRQNHYNKAVKGFLRTKELIEGIENSDNEDFIDTVNQSLADTLIKRGDFDAGSLFLQHLYTKKSSSSSLKEYARNYMDSIQSNYLLLTLSSSFINNSNIGSLNSEELKALDKETYISKDANSLSKSFNLFYSSKKFKYLSSNFSFNIIEENHNHKDLYFRDYRNFNVYLEGKYDNLIKSIIKIYYLYNKLYLHTETKEKFNAYATTQTVSTEYIHSLKSGTISYQVPLTSTKLDALSNEKRFDYGIKVTYIPYIQYKYFSPTYSVSFDSIDEGGTNKSFKSTASFSNHFIFKKNFSTFLSLDYILNINKTESLDYSEGEISSSISYAFRFLKGLSSTLTYSYSDKWTLNDKINIQKYSLGFAYTF